MQEGADYWYRQRMHDNPKRRSHSIVLSLYAAKTLCACAIGDEDEAQAKELFSYIGTVQQALVPTCMQYLSSHMVYHINWMPLHGQRIYPLKGVLQSLGAVPAMEMVLRKEYPQHFTLYSGKPYMSYGLAQLLHLQHWLSQWQKDVKDQQPFADLVDIL